MIVGDEMSCFTISQVSILFWDGKDEIEGNIGACSNEVLSWDFALRLFTLSKNVFAEYHVFMCGI